jgi:hypothetical protein
MTSIDLYNNSFIHFFIESARILETLLPIRSLRNNIQHGADEAAGFPASSRSTIHR